MSKRIAIYVHFLAAVVLLASCSTKSAKWANVAYHNTTAHYNIWWNGNESLKEAVELLEKDAADDYTQMLPVAKLGTKEEVMKVYPQLDRAIEKGVKGVKKHSIFLKGKEHVSYIAKCYLLTAYGSFYKKDYVTAINTSRMMISQYSGSEAADEAGIILGRSLAATMQYDEAESTLDQLMTELGKGNFNKGLKEKLYLAMAEATLPQGKYKKGVQHLKLALEENPSRTTKARINFILGQVYQKLDKRSVATKYYNQCLSYGPDYVMEFNARINVASCADLKHSDVARLERDLDKMLRDKKNEEYHDQIYYAKGEMYMGVRRFKDAVESFARSVAVSTTNKAQKTKSALRTAEVYYERFENYDAAQLYYDTAMALMKPDYPGYADIKVRYDMLTALTSNTRLIALNDSLIRVAEMTPEQRKKHIQSIIDKKKKEEEEMRQREELAQIASDIKAQQNTLTGDWYFYNSNTVQKGKETFQQRWGTRPLEDYWTLSKKSALSSGSLIAGVDAAPADEESDDAGGDSLAVAGKGPLDAADPNKVAFYEKDLPFEQTARDSLNLVTAEALLNAGYLYYDAIGNYERALECYLRLASEYPTYEHIVQAFYMLYRIYDRQGNSPSANYYRDMVLMGFPDSDFANLIRDENFYREIASRERRLHGDYDDLYTSFRRKRYKEVINKSKTIAEEYPNDAMLPKFRYWEAMAYSHLNDNKQAVSVFQSILASVAPTDSIVPLVKQQLAQLEGGGDVANPIAKSNDVAQEQITDGDEERAKKKEPQRTTPQEPEEVPLSSEAQMFRFRENMQHYVIIIVNEKKIRVTDLQYKVSDFNSTNYSNAGYRVNPMMFTDTTQLLTVYRFNNANEAMDYVMHLSLDDSPLRQYNEADYHVFPISTQNYTTFYSRKNIAAYKEFLDRYYKKK